MWKFYATTMVCLVIIVEPSAAQSQLAPEAFPTFAVGTWVGVGTQGSTPDQMRSWSIALVVDQQAEKVSIAYPSLRCNGVWKIMTKKSHQAWFRETIHQGKKRCVSGGHIAVTPVDSRHLTFSYFSKGKLVASATLTRK